MFYLPDPRAIGFFILYGLAIWGASYVFNWSENTVPQILVGSLVLLAAIAIILAVLMAVLQVISWITGKDFGLD